MAGALISGLRHVTSEAAARTTQEAVAQEAAGVEARDAPAALDKLNDDMLHAIFSTLNAFWLAAVLGVCKHWRAIGQGEDLWACACRARWDLPMKPGRPYISCMQERAASWLHAYRIYHRLRRPPAMHNRVVYAHGMRGCVGAWLQVKHQPACALVEAAQHSNQQPAQRVLRVCLLVQNLRSEALGLAADALQMTYRGITRPFAVRIVSGVVVSAADRRLGGKQAAEDSYTALAASMDIACRAHLANADSVGPAAPPAGMRKKEPAVASCVASKAWRLSQLDVALLHCEITALAGMTHEPDVLEACDMLHVWLTPLNGPSFADAAAAYQAALTIQRPIVVGCRFVHDRVYEHYQQVNREFWLHDADGPPHPQRVFA